MLCPAHMSTCIAVPIPLFASAQIASISSTQFRCVLAEKDPAALLDSFLERVIQIRPCLDKRSSNDRFCDSLTCADSLLLATQTCTKNDELSGEAQDERAMLLATDKIESACCGVCVSLDEAGQDPPALFPPTQTAHPRRRRTNAQSISVHLQ